VHRSGGMNDLPTFFWAEYFGYGPAFGQPHGVERRPLSRRGDSVEEFDGTEDRADGVEGQLFAAVEEVLPDLLFGELVGRRGKVFGEFGDCVSIRDHGVGTFAVEYKVFTEFTGYRGRKAG